MFARTRKLLGGGRSVAKAHPISIEVAGRSIPLHVRENARAKRLILRIAADGSALVTVPPRTGRKMLEGFLARHHGWIAERAGGDRAPAPVENGSRLFLRGEPITIVHRAGRHATRIDPQAGELIVGGAIEHLPRRVADFLKREARQDLASAVERHACAVGLKPRAISLKDTTSRWGSCTSDRRLAFSWRIVMAPPHVLDYLAAHEVAHFAHMNHSPRFWALCRTLCPRMDEGRTWLKTNGAGLHRIRFERTV